MKKKSGISHKQLQQENKILGNIISKLKSNKHQLEENNKKLQHHIHYISSQNHNTKTENNELRNLTIELKSKLESYIDVEAPQLKVDPIKNLDKSIANKEQNNDLLTFLKNVSNTINNIESNLCRKEYTNTSVNNSKCSVNENHIHCYQQEIHKLEMEKLDLLKYNQQCILQLKDIVNDYQKLQQKTNHLENENIQLRHRLITKEPSYKNTLNKIQNPSNNSSDLSILSFENLIKEVERMEKENKSQQELKTHVIVLNDELLKLKEELIDKQNQNECLLNKYNTILTQYNTLCLRYI